MASPTSTTSARRARDARRRAGTPRWEGHAAAHREPPTAAQVRRRRLARRLVPALIVAIGVALVVVWWADRRPMSPAKVAIKAHDPVLREVIDRTGDYSTTLGPLSCTEIRPGKGNCLATMRSQSHQTDGVMVAAAYDLTQGDGGLNLIIKLP